MEQLARRPIVVVMEATSLISAFECMNNINGNVTIFLFDKHGFKTYTITDPSQDSTTPKKKKASVVHKREVSQFNGIFASEWLSRYYYDETLGHTYAGSVNTDMFLSIMKNLKKEVLEFSVNLCDDGEMDKIHMRVPKGEGEKYINFDSSIDQVKYIDPLTKYYSNVEPIAKPFNKTFQLTCSGIRQTKCTSVRFVMNTDNSKLSIILLSDGDNVISRETLSHANEPDADTDTLTSIEVPADCWITKVAKLSNNACTQIYMSEDRRIPLIFKTHIGAQGYAICSIRMVK